jgi:uracil-DNA glycosylase family 4
VDAQQDELANPFDMDEDCRHCEALCETRSQVVHGYGDVGAEFLFVGTAPGPGADRTGHPFTGDEAGRRVLDVLGDLGLCSSPPDTQEPDLHNVFLTYCTRCRHPEREPTETEVRNCDAFLTAEIRMINPEILVPVGQRALTTLGVEYTTTPAEDLSVEDHHATSIRGRGFELFPMREPEAATDADLETFVDALAELMDGDYRQTKGRRER